MGVGHGLFVNWKEGSAVEVVEPVGVDVGVADVGAVDVDVVGVVAWAVVFLGESVF